MVPHLTRFEPLKIMDIFATYLGGGGRGFELVWFRGPKTYLVTSPKKTKINMDSRIMGTFRNGHFLSAWILLWVWMTTVPSSMWSILKRGLQLSFSYQVCQNRMKRSQVKGSSVQEF